MASCPKCQKQLGIKDWRQNCPYCGVNIILHDFEGRFYADAKRSELSAASSRVLWKRIKAGFTGSKNAKTRLALMPLPLLVSLMPAAVLQVKLPLAEQSWNTGLLGLFGFLTNGETMAFLQTEISSPLYGGLFTLFAVLLAMSALTALVAVAILFCSLASIFNIRRFSLINVILCCIGAVVMLGTLAVSVLFARADQASAFLSGTMTGAPLLSIAVFAIVAFINGRLFRHGVPLVYTEGDEERAAIYKNMKKGKVSLDDLPFPVVETDETRKREAMIQEKIAESAAMKTDAGGVTV